MISIHNLDDLQPFGINPLTGEACRVGRRILCDLTDDGRKIVADMLGLDNNRHTFPGNWNGKVNGRPAVASFMLPYDLAETLAIWCLLDQDCEKVVHIPAGRHLGLAWSWEVLGLEKGDDDDTRKFFQDHIQQAYELKQSISVIRNNTNLPGEGTRCTHAMSGRTE